MIIRSSRGGGCRFRRQSGSCLRCISHATHTKQGGLFPVGVCFVFFLFAVKHHLDQVGLFFAVGFAQAKGRAGPRELRRHLGESEPSEVCDRAIGLHGHRHLELFGRIKFVVEREFNACLVWGVSGLGSGQAGKRTMEDTCSMMNRSE